MELSDIQHIDIYLLDQLLKNRIGPTDRILDAGCGYGRNFRFFAENTYDITGIDPNHDCIDALKAGHPDYKHALFCSTIENWTTDHPFDFIICNAVLHFAEDHTHFDRMFDRLVQLMRPNGILFVRTATKTGMESFLGEEPSGRYRLPDGSDRYLITRDKIIALLTAHELTLLEPIKSVIVDQQRAMATLVFRKG